MSTLKGFAELLYVVERLMEDSEEFDSPEGMARYAQQQYWDDVEQVMENLREQKPEKQQSWEDAVNECVSDTEQRNRLLRLGWNDAIEVAAQQCDQWHGSKNSYCSVKIRSLLEENNEKSLSKLP
jgi:glutamine synthetase adenylyltransferase